MLSDIKTQGREMKCLAIENDLTNCKNEARRHRYYCHYHSDRNSPGYKEAKRNQKRKNLILDMKEKQKEVERYERY